MLNFSWGFYKYWVVLGFFALFLGGGLYGCGSGNDSSNMPQTGTVALLLTDHPVDELKEVNVTINEISLLSDDSDPVVLFKDEAGHRANLLHLQDVQDLFMVHQGVPAGHYSKIRLRVSHPEFVFLDGMTIPSSEIHLVANGKVDLNPRGPFHVVPGETLTVLLDMDVEKSIHIHEDDTSKTYQFRPVVFVTLTDHLPTYRVQVQGEIHSVDLDNASFKLEDPDGIRYFGSHPRFKGLSDEPHDLHTSDDHVIRVTTGHDTRIFDEEGLSIDFTDLRKGQKVTVRGLLSFKGGLHIKAHLICLGELSRMRGNITAFVNFAQFAPVDFVQFVLTTLDRETVEVRVNSTTLIWDLDTKTQLSPEELTVGMHLLIEGKKDSTGLFHAVTIFVKPLVHTRELLMGIVQDLENRRFNLLLDDSSVISVKMGEEAVVLRVSEGSEGLELSHLSFAELQNDDRVLLLGQFEDDPTFFEAVFIAILEGGVNFDFADDHHLLYDDSLSAS